MKKTLFKRIWISIIAIVLLTVSFAGCSDESELQGSAYDSNISLVKEGCPELIPHITYEDAYKNFYSDPQWRGFESEDGSEVVEFSGGCTYLEEEATIYIQFTLDEGDSFYMNYASLKVDGEEIDIDDDLLFELLYNPFDQYSIDVLGEELGDDIFYSFVEAFEALE